MVLLKQDAHQLYKVTRATLGLYQKDVAPFTDWLEEIELDPTEAEEIDELLIIWKNLERSKMTKTKFGRLVAGVILAHPNLKGHLPWSGCVIHGWDKALPPMRTFPLERWLSRIYAQEIALMGYPELAVMSLVQQVKGLRPSEAINLKPEEVLESILSQAHGDGRRAAVVLKLGDRTKKGRAETALFREGESPELVKRLLKLKEVTPKGVAMSGVTTEKYRKILDRINLDLNNPFRIMPHSPRAGFATDSILWGKSVPDIMREGRWTHEATFKGYIDLLQAMAVQMAPLGEKLRSRSQALLDDFVTEFPWFG